MKEEERVVERGDLEKEEEGKEEARVNGAEEKEREE